MIVLVLSRLTFALVAGDLIKHGNLGLALDRTEEILRKRGVGGRVKAWIVDEDILEPLVSPEAPAFAPTASKGSIVRLRLGRDEIVLRYDTALFLFFAARRQQRAAADGSRRADVHKGCIARGG